MALALKRRILAGMLLVLALWPLGHIALVRVWHVNPWRFGGWAMYAVYYPKSVNIRFDRCDNGEPPRCGQPVRSWELSESVKHALLRFNRNRAAWGDLYPLDEIATCVAQDLDLQHPLSITLTHWALDPSTGRVDALERKFLYTPRGLAARCVPPRHGASVRLRRAARGRH